MVADVPNPILGADFLKHYDGLVVDMRRRGLLDTRTQLSVQDIISSSLSPSPILLPKKPTNDFTAIMAGFLTITQPRSKDRSIKHDITHRINATGPPVSARPRKLAPERLKIARQEFEHMLELGIVNSSVVGWFGLVRFPRVLRPRHRYVGRGGSTSAVSTVFVFSGA